MSARRWCVAVLLSSFGIVQSDGFRVTNEDGMSNEHHKMMGDAFELTNPNHVNGEELYESDILLTPQQRKLLAQRKAIRDKFYLWPTADDGNVHVPYIFNDGLVDHAAVMDGLSHWEEHTCIRFMSPTNYSQPHLKFHKGMGCWSYVGMIFYKEGQDISIGEGCTNLGTVVHEIGHAIGFYHEHSRSDRDDYVHINEDQIESGKEHNFNKENDKHYGITYDYISDMHYSARYASKNRHVTIATINPLLQELIGKRSGLSHYDKLLANTMYPCIENWLSACGLSSDPCQNDGYTGADCNCVCPMGTSGTNCETIDGGYYDSLLSGCSENVTEEGTITSPNYPGNYPANLKCVKWIQAPSDCYVVQLTFNSFQIYEQNPFCYNDTMCCYFEILEIRTNSLYNGDVYCDTMISPGQVFTSSNETMILYFETATNYYQGWSADVAFIPSGLCPTTSTSTTTTTTTTTPTTTTTTTPTTTTTTTTPTTTTTTTTPTTTTTTTTPTTTTTTTPTTTTTTPTTTITPAADCETQTLANNELGWTSPLFGQENYPNDAVCSLNPSSSGPKWATIEYNTFELEPMSSNCTDYVSFSQPHDLGDKIFCGSKTGRTKLPSFNLNAKFNSDGSTTAAGFNVTIIPKSSKCHKLISANAVGETEIIKSLNNPSATWKKQGCEFWIESPVGTQITLQFITMKLNNNCEKSAVLVDGNGDPTYPLSSSQKYCNSTIPAEVLSQGNKMNVMFYAITNTRKFKARWTVN